MSKNIYAYMNNKNSICNIGRDIVNMFVTKADNNNFECSFTLAKGTGMLKNKLPNTTFNFDTEQNTSLDKFKKMLFDEELNKITKQETKQLEIDISNFLEKVGTEIIENYSVSIKDVIRKVLLPSSKEEDIPLNTIQFVNIDIVDFSSVPEPSKYLLKIEKRPNTHIDTESITTFVFEQQEKTGQSPQTIFQNNKNTPLFNNVITMEKGERYLFDVGITLFVDYSLSQMPSKYPELPKEAR